MSNKMIGIEYSDLIIAYQKAKNQYETMNKTNHPEYRKIVKWLIQNTAPESQ